MTAHNKAILYSFILFLAIITCAFTVDLHRHKNVSFPFDKIKVEGGYISGIVNATNDIHIFKGIPCCATNR